MPKFTVLIAVYNAEIYLEECLQSLLAQTVKEWQAICIDDCSSDHSMEILKRYHELDARFMLLSTPENSGQAVARNLGLPYAKGEFTFMLDADDYLAPDALEILWKSHLNNIKIDAMLFNLTKVWEDGKELAWEWPDERRTLSGKEACLLSIDWRIHGCCAIRTSIHQALPFDTTFRVYSDDTTVRLQLLECEEVSLTEGIYYYRQHSSSATHRWSLQRLDFIDANRLLSNALEEREIGELGLQICEDMNWKIFVGIFREMYQQKNFLTKEEQNEVTKRLINSLAKMKPERLSKALRRNPSYLFISNYFWFQKWQKLLLDFRKILKPQN